LNVFKSNDVIPYRAGRVGFGAALIGGAVLLASRAPAGLDHHGRGGQVHAWDIVVGIWVTAFTALLLVPALASLLRRSRNSDALRVAALTVPSVGLALMLPITIHMLFVLPSGEAAFDEWTWLSAVFVGHVHVVFALLVWARARSLASGIRKPVSVKLIYLLTCVAALIPFVIPVVFVAVTGLPLIPLLRYMETVAAEDREASRDIPYAEIRT
jgi:hypothetical protein